MAQGSVGQQRKSKVYEISSVSELPSRVPRNTDPLLIDFSVLTEDVDLTSYVPAGLPDGAEVTFRKLDESKYKIKMSDAGVDYHYVDKKGETITLVYVKSLKKLRVK